VNNLSVVINVRNEEKNLPNAIASVKNLAEEIVVIDMESEDKTVEIAKKLGAKVFTHNNTGYVEPARNFGVEKTKNEWVLIIDADEKIGKDLSLKIKETVKNQEADYFRIPRKNYIFGKWIKHTMWWPDYNIRLFRKGCVIWSEEIHKIPITKGKGADFPEKESLAIIHENYKDVDAYLERMIRYSKIQAEELIKKGYVFHWTDIVRKPVNEFLSRYFAGEGYRDGIHGLSLSMLQAFSELVLYLRVWGKGEYQEKNPDKKEIKSVIEKSIKEIKWWTRKEFSWIKNLRSE
jgi:(heptosyl)LPS beta-1,4-glucosyltransferase